MKVEIYSDIACPWCYLGKARFEQALAAYPLADQVEVVYRPFQLDPSAPQEPLPHREVLASKFGPRAAAMDAHITDLGTAENLTFDFDTVVENNSLLAHRLLRYALDEYGPDAQARLKGRLLAAHFGEGMDIGDHEQLTDVAVAVGLDREAAAAFLHSDALRDEVLDDIETARQRGITAVPTFVFEGQWAVQGGQEPGAFLSILEQVAQETAAAPPPPSGQAAAPGTAASPDAGAKPDAETQSGAGAGPGTAAACEGDACEAPRN
ncbi:DsbA family oxidoreductase [Streptomyces zagrosensis]|uniref:Putative DsbA family dithiol-disulfide isomerase n=1 Tax=Streptomyces zagrosensis TaxID=1042984 RepID=A0A7W9Q5T6_9ACTN|nr:DsbA family oxidoreductase [Streptomyces zagrosensis]MBB5933312.1 putative DsbA family dithiol-disulfide isomerase [Streptomyces zagrosensis]